MDVFEAIQKRKSVRNYEQKPVSKETLQKILDAGRSAPSAGNLQPWHFVVVTDPEKRKALSKGVYAKFLQQTPVVVVLCGDEKASPHWYVVDVALAGENMVLAATAEGLGTCWIGSFDEADVKDQLNIPGNLRVVAMLSVGYAQEKESLSTRVFRMVRRQKTEEDVVSWETYGAKTV